MYVQVEWNLSEGRCEIWTSGVVGNELKYHATGVANYECWYKSTSIWQVSQTNTARTNASTNTYSQFSVASVKPAHCSLKGGVLHQDTSGEDVCCAGSCGTCGGTGCSQRSGGAASCCVSTITASTNVTCGTGNPPCRLGNPVVSLQDSVFSRYVNVAQNLASVRDALDTSTGVDYDTGRGFEVVRVPGAAAQCPPGFTGPDGKPLAQNSCSASCAACAAGTYKASSGALPCTTCPAHSTSSASTNPSAIPSEYSPWTFRPPEAKEFTGRSSSFYTMQQ